MHAFLSQLRLAWIPWLFASVCSLRRVETNYLPYAFLRTLCVSLPWFCVQPCVSQQHAKSTTYEILKSRNLKVVSTGLISKMLNWILQNCIPALAWEYMWKNARSVTDDGRCRRRLVSLGALSRGTSSLDFPWISDGCSCSANACELVFQIGTFPMLHRDFPDKIGEIPARSERLDTAHVKSRRDAARYGLGTICWLASPRGEDKNSLLTP